MFVGPRCPLTPGKTNNAKIYGILKKSILKVYRLKHQLLTAIVNNATLKTQCLLLPNSYKQLKITSIHILCSPRNFPSTFIFSNQKNIWNTLHKEVYNFPFRFFFIPQTQLDGPETDIVFHGWWTNTSGTLGRNLHLLWTLRSSFGSVRLPFELCVSEIARMSKTHNLPKQHKHSPGASDIRRKFKWRTQANLWRKFAWLKLKCFFSKSPHHFRSNIHDVSSAKMPHVYYFRMFLKRHRVFVVNEGAKSNQNKQATSGTLNFCSSILTGTI